MKPASLFCSSLPLLAALGLRAAPTVSVVVDQDAGLARPAEMISVPLAELRKKLPEFSADRLAVRREGKDPALPVQFLAEPASRVPGGELIFLADLAAVERRVRFSVTEESTPAARPSPRVFGRAVPERFDDFAFENDRVAHRVYGPALSLASAGREQLTSSGVDVWCKRTRSLVVDNWYSTGNYHADHGQGLDFYHVGRTRGCGGSGFWDDGVLRPSGNWTASRVLAPGPIRLVFELDYAEWDAGHGARVSETKRFTIDAGRNLHRVESRRTGGGGPRSYAIGIAKHPPTQGAVTFDLREGWMTKWESYGKPEQGELGTAVLFAERAASESAEDEKNHLLVAPVRDDETLVYYFGAGWTRSGDFADADAWRTYVGDFSARLRHPVTVTVE